jgi:hypothetical protein
MNERIKVLAEQAEFSEKDLHIQGDNFQKFAELIIHECAEVARLNTRVDSKVYLMIQEHFGVEE